MNDDCMISGFDPAAGGEAASFAIDFTSARRLQGGGSTCDAYECTVQRRRVFVKRLKEVYRNNPLYRAAFDKEFDLGVSLSHPSLPRYVGFGGDYIVMDFIEGETLAGLIKRGDRRLRNRKFVSRLLRELVDVVDYLHNRNIVHCDIKADNIIISPYADRPATLIDFDKAYSPWLGSTHGDAVKYGCDGCADGAIDFKGVGMIADRLGLKRFGAACSKQGASAESLKRLLVDRTLPWALIVPAVIGAVALTAIILWNRPASTDSLPVDSPSIPATDSVYVASPVSAIDTDWIGTVISKHLGNYDAYRMQVLDTISCDTLPLRDKTDAINRYSLNYLQETGKILSEVIERYAALPESDVQTAVRTHPEWLRLQNEDSKMNERLAELYASKRFQRSSDRPASPPDTLPGDSLPAQHH
ncbi:MAG: protein kinase [Muribaculaceae bacterium]|nr:protein kinase [Muribaculaceae bacterium]